MKKLKIYILAFAVTVIFAAGCAENRTDVAALGRTEMGLAAEEITVSETAQGEITEQEKTGEYFAGPGYDEYLYWTAEEWLKASEEEQIKAVMAYTAYWGKVTGQKELSLEAVEREKETVKAMLETLRSSLSQDNTAGVTLKEIAEEAGSYAGGGGFQIETAGLGEYRQYLFYTSEDWAAAGEEEREKVTLAYVLLSCAFAGNNVDAETLLQSGVILTSYTEILNKVFKELEGTGCTLEEALQLAGLVYCQK